MIKNYTTSIDPQKTVDETKGALFLTDGAP